MWPCTQIAPLREPVYTVIISASNPPADDDETGHEDHGNRIVFPIETSAAGALDVLRDPAVGAAPLVLPPQRLRVLGAPDAADFARLSLEVDQAPDLEACRQLAYGPASGDEFGALGLSAPERVDRATVALLKRTLLIPAALTAPIGEPTIPCGVKRVRLLTNNPRKVAALEAEGIEVTDREAIYGRVNEHNRRYLRAKADRSGHLLETWLGAASESD